MDITARFEEIRDRLESAAGRAGRAVSSARLVAVTKTRSVEEIDAALRAGVTEVGENKVQEAADKKPAIALPATWHFIGHLQKNKARRAVELFDLIHTVHSVAIAERLDRIAEELNKQQSVLVQVDLAGEATKFGLAAEALFEALEALKSCAHLDVRGLMVLPPYLEDAEAVRPYFRRLREMSEKARAEGLLDGDELSMGMSHDFEVAIEEGATLVRVGTALFGPRPKKDTNIENVV